MDFTLGLVTGMYAVLAVIVFYVVYVIEVKLGMAKPLTLTLTQSLTFFIAFHTPIITSLEVTEFSLLLYFCIDLFC